VAGIDYKVNTLPTELTGQSAWERDSWNTGVV